MDNEQVRDCENCRHYKNYKDDLYACEKWECDFERRDEDGNT